MNHIRLLLPPIYYQSKKRIYFINLISKKKKREFDTMMTLVGHDFLNNNLPKKYENMKDSLNFIANMKYLYGNGTI